MKRRLKQLLRPWLPPIVASALRRPREVATRFEGSYSSWAAALASSAGYDRMDILDRVEKAALRVAAGEAVYERDSVLFDHVQISWPLLSSLLWAAALNHGRLHVLDFGGSLGTTYRQNKVFLDSLPEVRWGIVEQPHFVASGQRHFSSDRLSFFHTIEECVAAIRPSIAVLGSALHYVEEPFAVLRKMAATDVRLMVLDRTPFLRGASDVVTIQHVPPHIYEATYPMWVFAEETFLQRAGGGWQTAATFECAGGHAVTSAGLEVDFKGMVLTR